MDGNHPAAARAVSGDGARFWRAALVSGAVLGAVFFWRFSAHAGVTLHVDLVLGIARPSKAQVFWSGRGGVFAAERGVYFDVQPGAGGYDAVLPDDPGKLRIDPLSERGLVEVGSIVLSRRGVPLRRWGGRRGFQGWRSWNQTADFGVRGGTLRMWATGPDPGFAYDAPLDLRRSRALVDLGFSAFTGLAAGLLASAAWRLASTLRPSRGVRRNLARAGRFLAQSAAILALGLGLAEAAMRVYHHFVPVFVFPSPGTNRFRGQPFAPDYSFHLNSHGFKDVEVEPARKPGTVRILGLGDSFAFGIVPYENNYLTLLEEDLNRVSPPVEVVNMGIPSIGPRGYLEVLANEGLPLHADLVLLSFFVGNDFTDEDQPAPRSYVYAFFRYLLLPKPKGVPIHSDVRYEDDRPSFPPDTYLEMERHRSSVFRRSNPAFGGWLDSALGNLERIRRLCDAKSLGLWIVVIPDEMQVNQELQAQVVGSFPGAEGDFDFGLPNRRLDAELGRLGIRHLDLLGHFKEVGRTTRLYRPRDSHWNIAGNRLAADLIRDELRRDAKLRPRSGT